MTFLRPDGNPLEGNVITFGRTGVIIRKGSNALKLPRSYDTSSCTEPEREYFNASAGLCHDSLEGEKSVYRHLGRHEGIVECFEISDAGIEMAFMKNGDLADYLQRKPERSLRLAWIQQMASTMRYVHKKNVIIADVATKNFLVADDLSIKLCDFTESTIMPADVNMDEADDAGYSVQTDIGQFGAVMYEVVTGTSYDFDLFKDQADGDLFPRFPSEEHLPNTDNIWLGPIIQKCWRRGSYKNIDELCHALARAKVE